MKRTGLYIIALFAALTIFSCENPEEEVIEKQNEYKGKSFERELQFAGYAVDTVIPVNEFVSAIDKITKDADWLNVAISDAGSDSAKVSYQLRIACTRNTTTSARSTDVVVTCVNTDTLKLKVNQSLLDGFDDLHDNVTDQPALTPTR